MKVALNKVRGSFLNVFEAKTVGSDATSDPRFSGAFAVEPGSKNHDALSAAVKEVAATQWKDKAGAVLKELRSKGRIAYREEALTKDGEVYDGFEGMHTLNASNKARPTVVDRDRTPLTKADGRPYSGCYVNVIVDIWAQDNSFGKRINCSLMGVQFHSDGPAFGGGAPARADEFADLSDGADADDDMA